MQYFSLIRKQNVRLKAFKWAECWERGAPRTGMLRLIPRHIPTLSILPAASGLLRQRIVHIQTQFRSITANTVVFLQSSIIILVVLGKR